MTPEAEQTTEVEAIAGEEPATPDMDLTVDARQEARTEPSATRSTPSRAAHRPWRIPAVIFVVVTVLLAAGVTLTRTSLFRARTIHVSGAVHLTRSDILRVAGITPGSNVFTFDAAAAERRLERDPWIADATITKDLPSTMSVEIRERIAVAVVESRGVLRLVADNGTLLDVASPRQAAIMPRIASTLEGAPEPTPEDIRAAALAIAAMVPSLRRDVDAVSILAAGQLRVDLRSGADVAYGPPVELLAKAQALGAVLAYAAGQGLSMSSADVRVPSAPTVQLGAGASVAP